MDTTIPVVLFLCFLVLLGLAIVILLMMWPVKVAKNRRLEPNMITAITLLSVLGMLFFCIGWIAAVIMAYTLPTKELKQAQDNIDKLSKLAELYQQGIITKGEFEHQKSKLLK